MATHGKAREVTIRNLRNCIPFRRSGFGMSLVEGKISDTGHLDEQYVADYSKTQVSFTVLSYATPIAWVNADGEVTIPDVKYSVTTTHHQNLCRVYFNK